MPQAHYFETSGDAYDASQCREDIGGGDVLAVPSEGVVGILVEAWPVAVTETAGAFHEYRAGWDWSAVGNTLDEASPHDMTASLALAREVAELFPDMKLRGTE